MSDQEETLLEPTEEIVENSEIEDEEYGSETGSNIEEDELTTVGGELPDIDDFEDEFEDEDEYGYETYEDSILDIIKRRIKYFINSIVYHIKG